MIESGHHLRNRPQPPPTPQEVVVWHWLTGFPVLTNKEIIIYIYIHHNISYKTTVNTLLPNPITRDPLHKGFMSSYSNISWTFMLLLPEKWLYSQLIFLQMSLQLSYHGMQICGLEPCTHRDLLQRIQEFIMATFCKMYVLFFVQKCSIQVILFNMPRKLICCYMWKSVWSDQISRNEIRGKCIFTSCGLWTHLGLWNRPQHLCPTAVTGVYQASQVNIVKGWQQ